MVATISTQELEGIKRLLRGSRFDNYKKYSLEKAWQAVVDPATKKLTWLKSVVDEPERQTVRHLLEELMEGCQNVVSNFYVMVENGTYVPDWMCDRDGFYIDKDSYHRDQIKRLDTDIESIEELLVAVKADDGMDPEMLEDILANGSDCIQKYRRFIGGHKTKLFKFKLMMNTKKQLHERKQQLESEIAGDKVMKNGKRT